MVAGERLTRGWVPLLRLLAAVPQRGSGEAIKLGFQSLELLCSDYLSSLTVEQLRRCLEVAALYANQQVRYPLASLSHIQLTLWMSMLPQGDIPETPL